MLEMVGNVCCVVAVCKVHVLSPWQTSSWITPTQWEMLVRKQRWSERPVSSYQLSPKSSFLLTALLSNSLSPLKIRYLHLYIWLSLLCSPPPLWSRRREGGNKQYCNPSVCLLVLSHVQHCRVVDWASWGLTPVRGLRTCSICTVVRSKMQLMVDLLVITIRTVQL